MIYEIVPMLYLSNYPSAREAILPSNILVINCTKNLPMVKNGIRISVNDDLKSNSIDDLTRSLYVIVPYIDKTINQHKEPVLVHCAAGQQRSAAVVAAYLIYRYGYTPDRAIQFIKSKKPDAFLHGVNFEKSIKDYYSYIINGQNNRSYSKN